MHGPSGSRGSRKIHIPDRGECAISVLDFEEGRLTRKWRLPNGGSPDMGGDSTDGGVR
ncbi:hypothetical protein [Streptomyces fuscichromogenes]|uniref:Uncharacterized protein n=1 Tax=Streptomyces fuscichromogenes TaxID=1324013 RepID=A0A918CQ02_9ACTN|nr:hypothetical protein GCM10011578_018300 [Streptomyces fuscichromogenes]